MPRQIVAHKATRSQLKLSLALAGPPGSGKTLTALKVMRGVVGPTGRIFVADTENGKASIYAEDPAFNLDFDIYIVEPPFSPSVIVDLIDYAVVNGYDGMIIDGLSPFWQDEGGTINIAEISAKEEKGGNKWAGWSKATPEQTKAETAMVHCKIHFIGTMHSNTEWAQVTDARGKLKPVELGLKPIQDKEIGYIFDIMGMMSGDGNVMSITKTRCWQITGVDFAKPGEEWGAMIRDWLQQGVPPPVALPPPSADIFMLQAAALGLSSEQLRVIATELALPTYSLETHYSSLKLIRDYLAGKSAVAAAPVAPPLPPPVLRLVERPPEPVPPEEPESELPAQSDPPLPIPPVVEDSFGLPQPPPPSGELFLLQAAEFGLDTAEKIKVVAQRLELPTYTLENHYDSLHKMREYCDPDHNLDTLFDGTYDLTHVFPQSPALQTANEAAKEQVNGHPQTQRRQRQTAP